MVKISSDTLYTNDNVALKVETRHYTREITFLNLHPSDFSLINSFEIPVQYNGRSSRLHIFINSHLYVPGESVIFYADSYTLKIDRNGYELFSVGTRRDQFNVKGNNGLTAITTTSFEEEIKLTTCEGKNNQSIKKTPLLKSYKKIRSLKLNHFFFFHLFNPFFYEKIFST